MQPDRRLRDLLVASGAVACGFAQAAPVEETEWRLFERWLDRGYHAGMAYMENYRDIRRDPRLLLPGAHTIVSVAFNYRQPNPHPEIATYALGEDYHKVLRRKLKGVVRLMKEEFGGGWRICIDSAPILERYWARKCGVGRRSPVHGNISVEGIGSMVFLAELITTLELEPSGELPEARLEADMQLSAVCPTGALLSGGTVDGHRCLNYLTIEKRGEFTDKERTLMAGPGRGRLFGCDACQLADPCNRGAVDILDEFKPLSGLPAIIGSLRRGDADGVPSISPLLRSPLLKS